MIRAICFNADVFKEDVRNRILQETGAEWGGLLAKNVQPNCLESFPDGVIYYSHANKGVTVGVTDCHHDIQQFIYVNSYGTKNPAATE